MADPRDDRPQPAYGEYAPEGWEWKPDDDEGGRDANAAAVSSAPDPLTGVPHNLGVPGGSPERSAAAPASGTSGPANSGAAGAGSSRGGTAVGERSGATPLAPAAPADDARSNAGDPPPYRAGERTPAKSGARPARPAAPAGTRARRPADIATTIVLLVIGAFGALYNAMMLFALPGTLAMTAEALDIADFTAPSWLDTFSTVTALSMFALYAVAAIFSVQRMRAGRIAFWVPLTAGVLATVLAFVFLTIAVLAAPELMQAMSDPDAMQKMLDFASSMQSQQ